MNENGASTRKRGISGDELDELRRRMTGTRSRNHLAAVLTELEAIRTKPPRVPAWARRRGLEELKQAVALLEASAAQ